MLCDYVASADARRRGPEGRPDGAGASPSWRRRARWQASRLEVRGRLAEGRRAADQRGLRVQALRHRVVEAAGVGLDGPRRAGRAAAGDTDTRPWPAGRSRRTATPSSTPSAAGRRRSRRTSSPGASSGCPRILGGAGGRAAGAGRARGCRRPRSVVGGAGRARHPVAGGLRGVGGEGRAGPGRGPAAVAPPFFAYSGGRGMSPRAGGRARRRGTRGLPDAGGVGRRGGRVLPPGRGRPAGHRVRGGAGRQPGIVYFSTSGYGQDGPASGWAGHDIDYLAVGGYLSSTGPRGDGGPPIPGATIADAAAGGMQAALAVMAALLARRAPARAPTSTCRWPTGSCR